MDPIIKIPYLEARKNFKPVDVLGWIGEGMISDLIQFVTDADVSHVSMILQKLEMPNYRWKQMEADQVDGKGFLGGKVHQNYVSESIKKYNGKVLWYKLHPDLDEYRDEIQDELFKQEGKGYDYPDLIMNLFKRQPLDDSKFFCSELVEWSFKRRIPVGVFSEHPMWITDPDFKIFLSNKKASRPGDIVGLPFLILQGELVLES